MRDRASISLHVLTIICFLASLASYLGGILGSTWWKRELIALLNTVTEEEGLLRRCRTLNTAKNCYYRKNIFKFEYLTENEEVKPDIIFVLLLISSAFCMISLTCSFALLCCRRDKRFWRYGTISITILGFSGALSGFSGVAYSEVSSQELGYDEGWSVILGWLGASTQFIGFILTNILLCAPPKRQDGGRINVRPHTNYPIFVERTGQDPNSYLNTGYQKEEEANVFSRRHYPEIRTTTQHIENAMGSYEMQ